MRAGSCLVVVLLLTACAGAPQSPPTPGASPSPVATTARAATPGEAVRILATDVRTDFGSPFAVAAATDAAEWDELWGQLGLHIAQPRVDFERELVLFLGMAGSSSCPERFERLVVDDTSRVYAEWAPPPGNQPCTDDLAAQGLLLAITRTELPGEPFAFSLRAQPICPDCADHPDQMVVDPR